MFGSAQGAGLAPTEHSAASTPPLVSILSTSFNHARWLPDTLTSVDRQTYPALEHVVVDDGSTDESRSVLELWPSRRLRWATTSSVGQARALNEAFRLSSGEILGWLSSDDAFYDSRVVEAVVQLFLSTPRASVVYGHAVLIDESGLQLQAQWVPPVRMLGHELPMHILQPAAFVRRSALGEMFVDPSFDLAMDTELWLRLRGPGTLVRLDRILAAERHHVGRKSVTLKARAIEEARRLDAMYRPAGGRPSHRRSRAWGVAFRLAGLSLIPRLVPNPTTFAGRLDRRLAIAFRQVLVPRARMGPSRS